MQLNGFFSYVMFALRCLEKLYRIKHWGYASVTEMCRVILQYFTPLSAIATVVIAILAFYQSKLTGRTIEEMKKSRTENVSPLLCPELGAKRKGIFDGTLSYIFDLKIEFNIPSLNEKDLIHLNFDMCIKNIGLGPAFNIAVK